MRMPFNQDEMFKLGSRFNPIFKDNVVYIDDFYENPDVIYDHLMARDYPLWKYNGEREQSRNGHDYFDCRICDNIPFPTRQYFNDLDRVLNVCRKYWHKGDYDMQHAFEVNCFQANEVFGKEIQHYPHLDSELSAPDNFSTLNFLVYLDKEEDGGTAIYDGEWITNDEDMNVLYPVGDRFKIRQIVEAKFNRAVIFPGNSMHGAYINDYSKYVGDKWRFTQVRFFHPR